MPCYDPSCVPMNLVNVPSLALSDTFNTWFDRTNQLIEVANAINIFDVGVGPTNGGMILEHGCSGGFYSGVGVLYVNAGAGLGIGVAGFADNYNKVVIDAASLLDYGGNTATNPTNGDYFIVSQLSDTQQGVYGTPKRVRASRMLPPFVEFGPSGDGTFTIQGNLQINGNIVVSGTQAFIDSNDLRIEDRLIELAYGRYAEMTVLPNSGTLTSGSFTNGLTAFYHDSSIPTGAGSATTIGKVYGWNVSPSGLSGTIQISSFTLGGVSDFAAGGNLVITGAAYTDYLEVTGSVGSGNYFLSNSELQQAGISIKGSEGDKNLLWVNASDNIVDGNWNAFVSNQNLGVSGSSGRIISSKFASYGYPDSAANNTFTYFGSQNSFTKYSVSERLVMEHSPTGSTGITFGIVHAGRTGPNLFDGVTIHDWVQNFNADQLDGAHASTASAPWTIPVMGADGRVAPELLFADSLRKTFNVPNHAFNRGDIVRLEGDGSLTFARATSPTEAEAIGMVDGISGNAITVIVEGFIDNLPQSGARISSLLPLVTGDVYFLSPLPGGRIATDLIGPNAIGPGEVQKSMFIASSMNSGFVLNYTGIVQGDEPTDVVFMSTFAPVGSIQPFAGAVNRIPPRTWLLCDGRRLLQTDYSELFDAIGQSYYADAERNGTNIVRLIGGTREIQANDGLRIQWFDTGGTPISADVTVTQVNATTSNVTVSFEVAASGTAFNALEAGRKVRVYGRSPTTVTARTFFIPDFRGRSPFGTSVGSDIPGNGAAAAIQPQLPIGQMGGSHTIGLNQQASSGSATWGNSTNTLNSMPPYTTVNWIIRAKKGADAAILTGHNHDLNYVRYNTPHTIAGGAANDLTLANRDQFRDNVRVLGDGRDGALTVRNNLSVTGNIQVTGNASIVGTLGVNGAASFASSVTVSGASTVNGSSQVVGSLTVTGGIFGRGGATFGTSSTVSSFNVLGIAQSRINLEPPLLVGLTGAVARSTEQASPPTVSVRDHRYDEFYSSGGNAETNAWGLNANTAKAVPLTIQTDSGQLGCVPMYRVAERMPTAPERIRLPQGFVWVNSAAGASSGSWIKSGQELYRMGSVSTDSGVPIGTIVIWSGTTTNIPAGWVLCNGQSHVVNGNTITTPDLRSRFVVGATGGSSSPYSVGRTGGATQARVTFPNHRHIFGRSPGPNWTNDDGSFIRPPENASNYILAQSYNTSYIAGESNGGSGTISAGAQSSDTAPWVTTKVMHELNGVFTEVAASTITSEFFEITPPYYALAYIMKIVGQVGEPQIPVNPSPLPCDPCQAAASAASAAESAASAAESAATSAAGAQMNHLGTRSLASNLQLSSTTFTDIPANAKRITINFWGISASINGPVKIRIGSTTGIESTLYVCSASRFATTSLATNAFVDAFAINVAANSDVIWGTATLTRQQPNNNTWIFSGTWSNNVTSGGAICTFMSSGAKLLANPLSQIQILVGATNSRFDGGEGSNVSIYYEV